MIDNNHPITPPPELVEQWDSECESDIDAAMYLAIQAARWGADQQLEECEKYWMTHGISPEGVVRMREHLRPTPSSLAEQALTHIDAILNGNPRKSTLMDKIEALRLSRRALERLRELESNG